MSCCNMTIPLVIAGKYLINKLSDLRNLSRTQNDHQQIQTITPRLMRSYIHNYDYDGLHQKMYENLQPIFPQQPLSMTDSIPVVNPPQNVKKSSSVSEKPERKSSQSDMSCTLDQLLDTLQKTPTEQATELSFPISEGIPLHESPYVEISEPFPDPSQSPQVQNSSISSTPSIYGSNGLSSDLDSDPVVPNLTDSSSGEEDPITKLKKKKPKMLDSTFQEFELIS